MRHRRAAKTCKLGRLTGLVDYIEAKRRIALVACRLTLDIVVEQEYHRHC